MPRASPALTTHNILTPLATNHSPLTTHRSPLTTHHSLLSALCSLLPTPCTAVPRTVSTSAAQVHDQGRIGSAALLRSVLETSIFAALSTTVLINIIHYSGRGRSGSESALHRKNAAFLTRCASVWGLNTQIFARLRRAEG